MIPMSDFGPRFTSESCISHWKRYWFKHFPGEHHIRFTAKRRSWVQPQLVFKRFGQLRVGFMIQLSKQPRYLCIYLSISTAFQQLDACGR